VSTLTINRLSDHIGAEIVGLDVERVLADDAAAAELMHALESNGVLLFRELGLEPETQVALCARFGTVVKIPGTHPVEGIYRVTLDKKKNANAEYLRGTVLWHIDGTTPLNDEAPEMATLLTALTVADRGGETEFASMYVAYDRLTDEEKERFESIRVVHALESTQRKMHPDPTPEQEARWKARPQHEHPLVWTHADGRKSLVLGATASHVVGMSYEEGRTLLDDLLERATAPELVYRHTWTVGDAVMWDNRGVVHRVEPYDLDSPREMLRTTVFGDEHIR
jgi:alpha-ketoglutarate-dependent taurine dioxygenase